MLYSEEQDVLMFHFENLGTSGQTRSTGNRSQENRKAVRRHWYRRQGAPGLRGGTRGISSREKSIPIFDRVWGW